MLDDARRRPTMLSMTIGELATRAGCSADTIRYYERVGVLPAAVRRGDGNYRRYATADVERLAFVRRSRELGFSLDEIRDLLSIADVPERPCADVDRIAHEHLRQIDAKLDQLAALRAQLQRVIGTCRGGVSVAECRILSALHGTSG